MPSLHLVRRSDGLDPDAHGLVVDTALLFAVGRIAAYPTAPCKCKGYVTVHTNRSMRKLVMLGLQEIKDGRPILRDLKAPARLVDCGGEEYPSLLPLQ